MFAKVWVSSNALPANLRVEAAITIWSAAASPCRRAAKLGVLPTARAWTDPPHRPLHLLRQGRWRCRCGHRQSFGGRSSLDGMPDLQGRPHGALGVFLPRGGPPKYVNNAITNVTGDKPVVARNHVAAKDTIRVQQAPELFGLEAPPSEPSSPPGRRTSPSGVAARLQMATQAGPRPA